MYWSLEPKILAIQATFLGRKWYWKMYKNAKQYTDKVELATPRDISVQSLGNIENRVQNPSRVCLANWMPAN